MKAASVNYILRLALVAMVTMPFGLRAQVSDAVQKVEMGRGFVGSGIHDSALMQFNEVLLIHSRDSLPDSVMLNVYDLLSTLYRREGLHYKALNYSKKGLEVSKALGDSAAVYRMYNKVAIVYALSDDFTYAIKEFKNVLRYARRSGDRGLMAAITANIGACLVDSGAVQAGLPYTEQSLEIRQELYTSDSAGNFRQISGLYFNLANTHRMLGQFEKALAFAHKSYEMRKAMKWDLGVAACAELYTKHYLDIFAKNEARMWLDSCRHYMESLPGRRRSYLALAARYYKLDGDFERAFDLQKQYQVAADSLEKVTESNKLLFARIDYEIQETRSRLELLEKEKHLNSAKLNNRNLQRTALAVILLAVLTVGGVTIFQLRQKARYALELARKNQEVQLLLRELQHRVKNNMQAVSSMFDLTFEKLNDEDSKIKLMEFRGSLMAMLLIQKRLYGPSMGADVILYDFLNEFVPVLFEMYGRRDDVELSAKLANSRVPGDFATKFGLLCTELISNSIKHAFKGSKKEESIWLVLKEAEGSIHFEYRDSGRGFSFEEQLHSGSTGIHVIKSLTRELNGEMEYHITESKYQFNFKKP